MADDTLHDADFLRGRGGELSIACLSPSWSAKLRDRINLEAFPELPLYPESRFNWQCSLELSRVEHKMLKAQTVSSLVLSLRKKEMIKVRQPLQKIMIPVLDAVQKAEIEAVSDLIKAEVNVKEIELLDDASGILVKQIKPNFKTLGPRFGKDMSLISNEIQGFGQVQIAELERTGELVIGISGKSITLTLEDVEISSQDIEGWLVANSNGITVALDITISDELRKEGIARELINRIQNIRKDSGFEVTDKIVVKMENNLQVEEAVLANETYIKSETLTETLIFVPVLEKGIEIEFDEIKTRILILK